MSKTRGLAALLAGGCVAYEVYTLRVQKRTAALGQEINDTWSQITRDLPFLDTLVGKAVLRAGLLWAADRYCRHLEEGSSSVSIDLHRAQG